MIKIITFSWGDPNLFEKYLTNIHHNDVMEVPANIAIDMAMHQAKICFTAGLNVMVKHLKDRNIIWVVVDDKSFTQR